MVFDVPSMISVKRTAEPSQKTPSETYRDETPEPVFTAYDVPASDDEK